MPAIVVNGVCRYAVRQSIGGQQVVNVIDMRIDTTGLLIPRSEAIEDVGRDILNNWNDHILSAQVDNLSANEIYYLDLDELDGPVGTLSTSSETTWPAAGGQTTGDVLPAMVAMRVDKATQGGRGTKRGRMYLAGMRENDTEANVAQQWSPSWVTSINASLQNFLDGINDQGATSDVDRSMCVVHRIGNASTGTSTDVEALTVNPNISTQVRRGVLR